MLFTFALAALPAVQVPAQLVGDIETAPIPLASLPGGVEEDAAVALGAQVYFRAWTESTGMELFRSDGSGPGTSLFADLAPGPDSSDPRELVVSGGALFFLATTPAEGRELWRSDGTVGGTTRISNVAPGPGGGAIENLTVVGRALFFVADDGLAGRELWRSDGTAAGTALVADFLPGPGSFDPQDLCASGDGTKLFFSLEVPGIGRELGVLDATTLTPTIVGDLYLGSASSTPEQMVGLGTGVVFRAYESAFERELWFSDGTVGGTQVLAQAGVGTGLPLDPDLGDAAVLGSQIYFSGQGSGQGREPWRTDGTPAGTQAVADVAPGFGSSDPGEFTVLGDEVYFAASIVGVVGRELFATAGTPETLRLVLDIHPAGPANPQSLVASGGWLYFSADDGSSGAEPWASDGTAAGTFRLADQAVGPDASAPAAFAPLPGGGALFVADAGLGREPYRADAAPASATLLADLASGTSTADSSPRDLTSVGGQALIFSAFTEAGGREPWFWSPTAGLQPLGDLSPGEGWSVPEDFTPAWVGDELLTFFTATSPATGRELWVTDGTEAGTELVDEYVDGPTGMFSVLSTTAALDRLFMSASYRLIWSDGTAKGTVALDGPPYTPADLTPLGDLVVFSASDDNDDRELWVTDGTLAGTKELFDLNPSSSSNPGRFSRVGDRLVFWAKSGFSSINLDLWATDGTAAGTQPVLPLGTAPTPLAANLPFAVLGDVAYFQAYSAGNISLWRTDLTAAGTFQVASITPSTFLPQQFVAAHDRMFLTHRAFGPSGEPLGTELFVSDGTSAGTVALDIAPGAVGSAPWELTPVGDDVLFVPNHQQSAFAEGAVPTTVYLSDGTEAGSAPYCAFLPGDVPTAPGQPLHYDANFVAVAGGWIWFDGLDPNGAGRELFRAPLTRAHVEDLGVSGSGAILSSGLPTPGGQLDLALDGAPAGVPTLWIAGAPVLAPPSPLTLQGSAQWVGALGSITLTVTNSTSATLALPIPADPVLIGQALALQAWTPGPTILPAASSNGLLLVFGD